MSDLWHKINSLIAHLHEFHVVHLVAKEYAKYGNLAPMEILCKDMNVLQHWLEENQGIEREKPHADDT